LREEGQEEDGGAGKDRRRKEIANGVGMGTAAGGRRYYLRSYRGGGAVIFSLTQEDRPE
jgi:hypothetical protein